jgi:hypothetical protein
MGALQQICHIPTEVSSDGQIYRRYRKHVPTEKLLLVGIDLLHLKKIENYKLERGKALNYFHQEPKPQTLISFDFCIQFPFRSNQRTISSLPPFPSARRRTNHPSIVR